MTPSAPTPDKRVVTLGGPLGAHLWVALCLGTGGAILAAAAFLGLSELLFAAKWSLLEGLFAPP